MSAAPRRRSCPEQPRSLPKRSFHPQDGLAGEIVGSNYERVVVKSLSPGGLVIAIAETHQGVPKERSKFPPCCFQLCFGSRCLQNLRNIRPHFQFGMPIVVSSGCK